MRPERGAVKRVHRGEDRLRSEAGRSDRTRNGRSSGPWYCGDLVVRPAAAIEWIPLLRVLHLARRCTRIDRLRGDVIAGFG